MKDLILSTCMHIYVNVRVCVNTLKLKVSICRIKGRVYTRELCSMLCGSLDGRGVCGRMDTCICVAESLCCSPETITMMLISYMPIQNKKTNNKKKGVQLSNRDNIQKKLWTQSHLCLGSTFVLCESNCKSSSQHTKSCNSTEKLPVLKSKWEPPYRTVFIIQDMLIPTEQNRLH